MDLRPLIRERGHALGFDAVGFAAADLPRPLQAAYRQYIAQGRQGDMAWLARDPERRQSPRGLWPEAQSVIVLGINYGPADDPLATLARRGERGAFAKDRQDDRRPKRDMGRGAPVLSTEARAALTLRLIGGLTTEEIAAVFD